jgi:uncharacterized protein YqeY
MSLQARINADLKAALLAGDKTAVMTLRGLKSALQNAEIKLNKRDTGLSDDEIITVLRKEVRQRQESAELYKQGGSAERAAAELAEKDLIERYLPEQLPEAEMAAAIDSVIAETGASGARSIGRVVGLVRQRLGQQADGAVIARLAKEKLG